MQVMLLTLLTSVAFSLVSSGGKLPSRTYLIHWNPLMTRCEGGLIAKILSKCHSKKTTRQLI